MKQNHSLDRMVATWMTDEAAGGGPDWVMEEILATTGRQRPQPRWLALIKEPPMRISSRVAVGSPTFRLATILALTMALVLAAAAAVVAGASLLPSPAVVNPPPAHNGLIAYASNHDIWVIRQDGTDRRQLSNLPGVTSSPIWSPDGARIAAWHIENGTATVLIVDADGKVLQTLAAPAGYSLPFSTDDHLNMFAAWSADGTLIAVPIVADGAKDITGGSHTLKEQDLLIFDLASGAGTPLHVGKPVTPGQRWSSDGELITFDTWAGDTDAMYAVAPDGTNLHRIANLNSGVSGDNSNLMLADGKTMLVDDYNSQSGAAVTLDGHGTPTILYTSKPGTFDVFNSVSPDGKSVAFIYEDDSAEDLHIMSIDGTGERELLKNVYNPAPIWSPDGTRVVVRNPSQYAVVTVDGSAPLVPIPMSADIGVVSWQAVP